MLLAYLQCELNPLKYAVMNLKNIFRSETEILNKEQLSKIIGGRKVEVTIGGKTVIVEVPD